MSLSSAALAQGTGEPIGAAPDGPGALSHCTVDPGTVPKTMDVLTPAGTSQADELDYTLHDPVTIAPVTVP